MIAGDQPTCFPPELLARVSSKSDGTVLDRAVGVHNPAIVTNRTAFCDCAGVSHGDVVHQRIVYDETQTYDKITEVKEQDTCKHINEVQADALVTDEPGVALMLPIADCVGTVIYDPVQRRSALVHLGRHSTIAHLMTKKQSSISSLVEATLVSSSSGWRRASKVRIIVWNILITLRRRNGSSMSTSAMDFTSICKGSTAHLRSKRAYSRRISTNRYTTLRHMTNIFRTAQGTRRGVLRCSR